jgi:diguanylate cyclase (GGDEF)-like protein/PAS domain S-box-containing protein
MPPLTTARRTAVVSIALAVVLAVAALLWFAIPRNQHKTWVLRVGVDHSPPFYQFEENGPVTGLAVDVLNEAARRRGIRLIWTPLKDIPIDKALGDRVVQLWPLVGMTKERATKFYMSEPWLESDYILLSTRQAPIRTAAEAAGKVIVHARLKFTQIIADKHLARSIETIRPYRSEAIQAVCQGEAAAALVESRVLDAILLTRPEGCERTQFHISSLPGATSPLAIAAVPEVREAAEALREGISDLTTNGFLSARLDEWSPFSAEGTRSIWARQQANQRSTIYRYTLMVIVTLALGLALVAWRAWRLKGKAERAETGLRDAQRRFTAFMDNSPAMSFIKDATGKLLYVNRAWSLMLNRPPDDCLGKDDFAMWPPDVARDLRAVDVELLSKDEPLQLIERIPVSPTDLRDVLVIKFAFENERGERFIGGTAIDVTEREVALRGLAASEARYRELFDQNPLPSWVCDADTLEFLTVNEAAVKRYGWTREDFLSGMKLADIQLPEHTPGTWQHKTKDGLTLTVDVTRYNLEYENRHATLMIVRDLTGQERMLEQLRLSEERWQLVLRGAGDALWDWDIATGHVFRSGRWRAMLGYEESEVGDTFNEFKRLVHPDDIRSALAALHAHLERATDAYVTEYRMLHKDGSWRWIMDRGKAVWDERGLPVRMAGSHTDMTERKVAENLLARHARTDGLTGLANRREFERLFVPLFTTARREATALTVCVCDLDRFKQVNDKWGHARGDEVLSTFSRFLRQHLRDTDLPARMGGDEFVLALPGIAATEAAEIMEKIREQLTAHEFLVHGASFRVSCSFGVAELRSGHADGDALIAEADRSLYAAKNSGRNRTLVAA